MAGSKNRRLVTEKRGFRVKPIKHPRYSYVVYRIADGRRVEQAYFQSERSANSHAHTENIRLKNEGLEGQILGPELRGQAIEATRRLAPYGKSLRDRRFLRTSSQVARFAAANQARAICKQIIKNIHIKLIII
jgi:hypothetical protein